MTPLVQSTARQRRFNIFDIYLAVAVTALVLAVGVGLLSKRSTSSQEVSRAGSSGPSEPASATPTYPPSAMPVPDTPAATYAAFAPAPTDPRPGDFDDAAARRELNLALSAQNDRLRQQAIAGMDNPDRSPLVLTPAAVDELEQRGNVIQ